MTNLDIFIPQATDDGSFTFFSQEFGESFHSHYGARQESFFKFVAPTQLALKATKPVVRLLDVCYGLGYNTAAALQTIWQINPSCYVEVIGLEINPTVPQAAITQHIFSDWECQETEVLSQLAFEHQVQTDRLAAKLLIGDARATLKLLKPLKFRADAIFLDPFSPPQCPQLWTVEFIQQLTLYLDTEGLLATYSCAAAVRTAFIKAGLDIGSTPPVGRRSPGTVAAHSRQGQDVPQQCPQQCPQVILPPLSQAEKEHLLTRAAIPYHDPSLHDPADVIIKRRQEQQQTCSLEPTSRWRKRWLSIPYGQSVEQKL